MAAAPVAASSLREAVRTRNTAAALHFIDTGADVHEVTEADEGSTILMWAMAGAPKLGLKVVRKLLLAGVNANLQDWNGDTALHHAFRGCQHPAYAIFLLDYGADRKIRNHGEQTAFQMESDSSLEFVKNTYTPNPLRRACLLGLSDVVERLISENPAALNEPSMFMPPLHMAALIQDRAMIELLVSRGADFNLLDNAGETPALMAAKGWDVGILKYLTEKGARLDVIDGRGWSALHHAAQRSAEMIEHVLDCGADIEARTSEGHAPLFLALTSDELDPKCVKVLIDRGANVDIVNKGGDTPLIHTLRCGAPNEEICKLLLAAGANPNVRGKYGCTALHWAVVNNSDARFMRALLEHGAMVDVANNQGRTALHTAARSGAPEHVRGLLDYGADKSFLSLKGRTPEASARRMTRSAGYTERTEVADLIRDYAPTTILQCPVAVPYLQRCSVAQRRMLEHLEHEINMSHMLLKRMTEQMAKTRTRAGIAVEDVSDSEADAAGDAGEEEDAVSDDSGPHHGYLVYNDVGGEGEGAAASDDDDDDDDDNDDDNSEDGRQMPDPTFGRGRGRGRGRGGLWKH